MVNKDSLMFSTEIARSAFDLHCQVGKMAEAMCSVDDTLTSLMKFNLTMGLVKFFNTTKVLQKYGHQYQI